MRPDESQRESLEARLSRLTAEGVKADRRHLKRDMCTQFTDPREWIREYVTNAHDAQASHVWIRGRRDATGRLVTITVIDDGHGMDRQGLIDFLTVFRSRKTEGGRTVGRHGIGKLSVAAIPGQCGFSVTTSTGAECWRATTGSLLDERPIELERVEPVAEPGTRFDVTFGGGREADLDNELRGLRRILVRYVRHLPLEIILHGEGHGPSPVVSIHEDWRGSSGRVGRSYRLDVGGNRFDVTLGLGVPVHELYQSRVLVTDALDLVSRDLAGEPIQLPHLRVRLDGAAFELPFGRHCLRNEPILGPITERIRERLLPVWLVELRDAYLDGTLETLGARTDEVDDIVCALLPHPTNAANLCKTIPAFREVNGARRTLRELEQVAERTGVLYLEGPGCAGVDYSVFDAPVLSRDQPFGGLDLLRVRFQRVLVNLGLTDVVIEAPRGVTPALGAQERRFEEHLRFHPDAIAAGRRSTNELTTRTRPRFARAESALGRLVGSTDEARSARHDVARLRWRVSWLVGPDGRTPCLSHRFLVRGDVVVCNLHHPEVRRLLALSERAPALAGHWGLAMVLTDPNHRVLEHLSETAREEILILDALGKCAAPAGKADRPVGDERRPPSNGLRDFLLDLGDERLE